MLDFNEMLESSVHFGHMRRKWNPKNGSLYILWRKMVFISLTYTKQLRKADEAAAAIERANSKIRQEDSFPRCYKETS